MARIGEPALYGWAIEKTRESGFDPQFTDLTRAARVKTKAWRPKLKGMQPIQLPTTPCQAASKTSARTRSKTQKTHGSQNAAKASAVRSVDTAAMRNKVRGTPAYATGAFPTLAPALVRRRPRRTSRPAKRPSPQSCRRRGSADDGQDPRRRRAECIIATVPRHEEASK